MQLFYASKGRRRLKKLHAIIAHETTALRFVSIVQTETRPFSVNHKVHESGYTRESTKPVEMLKTKKYQMDQGRERRDGFL